MEVIPIQTEGIVHRKPYNSSKFYSTPLTRLTIQQKLNGGFDKNLKIFH